jgi:hypothetical protein
VGELSDEVRLEPAGTALRGQYPRGSADRQPGESIDRESALRPGRAELRLGTEASPAPAPAAPTIEVTIGRIEVRAAPTPPRTTAGPTVPVMSLDQYLRSRSGGDRR